MPCDVLDRFDLKMKTNQREDEALEILYEVVEDTKTLSVLAAVDVDQGSNLAGCEGDVFIAHDNLQLLSPNSVWFRPYFIVFLHEFTVLDI